MNTVRICVFALLISLAAGLAQDVSYKGLKPDQFMRTWLVLKPIQISDKEGEPDQKAQKLAFDRDWLTGGEAKVHPQQGLKQRIGDSDLEWRLLESKTDFVNLSPERITNQFAIAYAWAEIEMLEKSRIFLGIGSDDGVKVWLNGKVIHENWGARAAQPDNDFLPIDLAAGKNQLLLKIHNVKGGWGFTVRPMGSEAQAQKLIGVIRAGDLKAARRLLEKGLDINSRGNAGLAAFQVARLRGDNETAEFLASHGADTKTDLPPREKVADALLSHRVKESGAGAAVLIAQKGKILFQRGYGLADLEHKVRVDPETKFRIGSITKQFTASAILKLQEDGKLSVQDKLSKFIPDFPRGDEVTIHHLLTHTSGIHSYTSKPDFMGTVTTPVKTEDLINSFKNDPYDFDPGRKWLYNNSGFFLLGYIIEKVSGQSFGDFLRQSLFEPLKMANTGLHRSDVKIDHEALGYQFNTEETFKQALNWDMSRAGGAGQLFSTVEDLYRWNEGVFNGKVLKAETLKAALTPVKTAENKDDSSETGYGYGWAIGKLRGTEEISHGGGLNGFSSYLLRLPKYDFTAVVLANALPGAPGGEPGQLAHDLVEIFLGDKLDPRSVPKANDKVASRSFDPLVGRYDYGGAVLTVKKDGDHLYAQLTDQPPFEIFPKSETEFFWKVVEAQVTFVKDKDGKVTKAIHRQNGQTINALRLPDRKEAKVDPATYDAFVGKYDYGQGKSILTVTRNGEQLLAQLTDQPKYQIFPESDTEFYWTVVPARVTFVKDKSGKVTKAIHNQNGHTFDAPKIE